MFLQITFKSTSWVNYSPAKSNFSRVRNLVEKYRNPCIQREPWTYPEVFRWLGDSPCSDVRKRRLSGTAPPGGASLVCWTPFSNVFPGTRPRSNFSPEEESLKARNFLRTFNFTWEVENLPAAKSHACKEPFKVIWHSFSFLSTSTDVNEKPYREI